MMDCVKHCVGTSGGEQQGVAGGAGLAKEAGEGAPGGGSMQHASSRQGLAQGLAGGPGRANVGEGGQEVRQGCQLLLQRRPVDLGPAYRWQRQHLYARVRRWDLHTTACLAWTSYGSCVHALIHTEYKCLRIKISLHHQSYCAHHCHTTKHAGSSEAHKE